jgi:hypothetical protein
VIPIPALTIAGHEGDVNVLATAAVVVSAVPDAGDYLAILPIINELVIVVMAGQGVSVILDVIGRIRTDVACRQD